MEDIKLLKTSEQEELIYEVLKVIMEEPTVSLPDFCKHLKIEKEKFLLILKFIDSEQYAINISFSANTDNHSIAVAFYNTATLTDKGIQYIKDFSQKDENSSSIDDTTTVSEVHSKWTRKKIRSYIGGGIALIASLTGIFYFFTGHNFPDLFRANEYALVEQTNGYSERLTDAYLEDPSVAGFSVDVSFVNTISLDLQPAQRITAYTTEDVERVTISSLVNDYKYGPFDMDYINPRLWEFIAYFQTIGIHNITITAYNSYGEFAFTTLQYSNEYTTVSEHTTDENNGTDSIIIAENVVVTQGNTYYNEDSRFTFSPTNIYSTFIFANTTIYGERTQSQHMRSGEVLEYSFDGRRFRFFLNAINHSDRYVTITIREYVN